MRSATVSALFLLACALAGCTMLDPTNEVQDFTIIVEPVQQVYVLTDGTQVRLRVRNLDAPPVAFDVCGQKHFERLENERLTRSWLVQRFCACYCTVTVKQGEQKEVDVFVWELQRMAGSLETGPEQSYRLWPVLYFDQRLTELVASEDIHAVAFRFTR